MNTEEVMREMAVILDEVAGVAADQVAMVEVVMAAEDKFGVKIPDEEVKNLRTVGDAVNFIVKSA